MSERTTANTTPKKSRGSVWRQNQQSGQTFGPLNHSLKADVAVIGAGITGLTTGVLLAKAGLRVALLEAGGSIGAGTSGSTTAHLTASYDSDFQDLEKHYGEEASRELCTSLRFAIDLVEQLATEHKISCDFARVKGYYYAETSEEAPTIRDEVEPAQRAGLPCRFSTDIPLPFPTHGGLIIDDQAQFDPMAYLKGLAQSFKALGGEIYTNTRVVDVTDGSPCLVKTENDHEVEATHVVMATHTPLGLNVALQSLVEPIMSYALVAKVADHIPQGLFWDAKEPYFYIRRLHADKASELIIGGCDRKTGSTEETSAMAKLEAYARQHFKVEAISHRWSAQLFDPADKLPFIGKNPFGKSVYVATGFSGDGMTFGTLAGWMIAHQIQGLATPYDELYKPARINKAGIKKFVKMGLEVGKTIIHDHLPHLPDEPVATLASGQGCVRMNNGEAIAAYRDEKGKLQTFSAVCPHMKCNVRWNEVESSFDCPCHGSRFDTSGKQLEGPALHGLSPVKLGEG